MTHPPPDSSGPAATPTSDLARLQLIADLRAVVVAIDKRTRRPGRAGEAAIAADASALRSEAMRRIGVLEGGPRLR